MEDSFKPTLVVTKFSPEYAAAFARLNRAWLQKYFYVEPIDEAMLSAPKEYYLDKGGEILIALLNNEVVGCVALLPGEPRTLELSKMAVDETKQGQKIGNRLLEAAIETAKAMGAAKIVLYSNTILQSAIHLYYKYGFSEIAYQSSNYHRSNIKMEKILA